MKLQGDTINVYALIRQLQHVCRTSSLVNWVSASKLLHVSVASILGVAGFILAAKEGKIGNFTSLTCSSEVETSSQRPCFVPGLQNLGNNCFLNVILQALASCTYFRRFIRHIVERCDSSLGEEHAESLPLTAALSALLEDLSTFCSRRMTLSPRKVMLAMNLYIPNFNLASQQDAAEAFLLLLCSLREELSECYVPKHITLADISASHNSRILTVKKREGLGEQDRWQQHFLGPFDGIICSILTCQTCSLQISLDYEFFHSLPIPLVRDCSVATMVRHTLEDCLKQFIVAEQVENYHCSRCWHIAAMKYLAVKGATEAEIEKLKYCEGQDFCKCRNILHLEALPWSNKFSRTYKQLAIARCPKILCIQLQRACINEFGEPIKVQGHIQFPLTLDLIPFTNSGVGIRDWDFFLRGVQAKSQYEKCDVHVQLNKNMVSCIFGLRGQTAIPESLPSEELGTAAVCFAGGANMQALQVDSNLPQGKGCLVTNQQHMHTQSENKVSETRASLTCMYHLISVVEHFGSSGSGHYTIYRRVAAADDRSGLGPPLVQWFCISDSDLQCVSEEDVLAAEATMLFYERQDG